MGGIDDEHVLEFGYALGRVQDRSDAIPTPESIRCSRTRRAVNLVSELGPVIHLVVELLPQRPQAAWSWTASGPRSASPSAPRAEVKVVTGERAPIDYVVG